MDCVVVDTVPEPEHTIIWLHGLGADANDFVPIVPQLKKTQSLGTRFIFPNAPVRPVTINGGMAMRAWYDIFGFDVDRDQDAAGIEQSVESVLGLVETAHDSAANKHIILAGFSQGGAIALRAGLASKLPITGIVALSTYLLQADSLGLWALSGSDASLRMSQTATTPIWMGHGTQDPIVPLVLGQAAHERLTDAGYSVDWHTWPMGHEVCLEEIERLDQVLGDWANGSERVGQ